MHKSLVFVLTKRNPFDTAGVARHSSSSSRLPVTSNFSSSTSVTISPSLETLRIFSPICIGDTEKLPPTRSFQMISPLAA